MFKRNQKEGEMAEHHEQGLTLSSIDPDGDYQKIVAAGATGFFVGAAYSIATNVWEQRLPATYFEAKLLAPEQSRSLGYYFGDIVKHGAIFASVGLAYSGTFTISKRLRETEDGWNYFWAAAATGALAGQRSLLFCFITTLL